MSEFSIKFLNYSKSQFERKDYWWPDSVISHPSSLPTEKLAADRGVEALAWSNNLQDIATGWIKGGCVWRNPANGTNFGVEIAVPGQVLHIGYSPYYKVWYDGIETGNEWLQPVDNPAKAWDFPQAWTSQSGVHIRVDSVAGGQSLSLNVTISEPAVSK